MKVGDKFHLLTVTRMPEHSGGKIEARCECGVVKLVETSAVRLGKIKSCGCYGKAAREKVNLKHGHNRRGSRSSLYKVWCNMLNRCDNPDNPNYPLYGGRGITVCDEWKDFNKFLEGVGERPANHTLDRIDVNKGYEPGNVRWATLSEQARNKRTNRVLALGDKSMCVADWVDETGLSSSLIINRIEYLGWSVEKALTTPARLNKRQKVKL